MRDQIRKYTHKLIADGMVQPGSVRFFALDDELIASHDDAWRAVFAAVFDELNIMGALLATPAAPCADYLVARSPHSATRVYPRDSETKTFLHDIPFIRRADTREGLAQKMAAILRERKGLIVEGVGIVATGTVTLEQAYIVYSSIVHATFIKYLCDVIERGLHVPGEREALGTLWAAWSSAPSAEGLAFRDGPLVERAAILSEIAAVGRHTVECGLVDSFFGNISFYHDGIVYISQTGASLDELDGLIDPVPMDNSSTCGITASSELAVHRKIYEMTGYHAILHGHPKFAVIMSMLCEKRSECRVADCGTGCPETRVLSGIPIVSGEIGAGGIATTVPPTVRDYGRALVFGHGPFCVGRTGFKEAFLDLVRIEACCRCAYFELLDARLAETT